MDRYVDRCIDKVIRHNLDIFGAVLIQGPKWCGKTTTAKRFARSSLSLSDPTGNFAALQLAQIDPAQAIAGPSPRLIDEWQEEPKLPYVSSVTQDRENPDSLFLRAQQRREIRSSRCIVALDE